MTNDGKSAIETARRRMQEAKEKFDRQQRRYAMQAVESETAAKSEKILAAKALLAELEAEFAASAEILRKLEQEHSRG
jgi:hypothetical protein